MEVIPLITYPNQELQIILENQDCTIKVYERSRYTFMDLSVGDSYIRRGQLCVPYAPILSEPCDFTGNFYVVDVKSQEFEQEPPEYQGWNSRWFLLYLTAAEIEELNAYKYWLATQIKPEAIGFIGYGLGAYGLMRYGLF